MSRIIQITLTNVGTSISQFLDLYCIDQYGVVTGPFESGVPLASLQAGYATTIDDQCVGVRVQSFGNCIDYIDLNILLTTSTTTTSTTSTTTTSTTTTSTTTTTTATPLQQMTINGIALTTITFTELNSLTEDVVIDWGDGNTDIFLAGSSTPTHTYTTPYTGLITIKSVDLTSIDIFNLVTTVPASGNPISIDTSELVKLDGLVTLYLGVHVYLNGLISQLPSTLQYATIQPNNLSGHTSELPVGLIELSIYGTTSIDGDVIDLPTGLTTCNIIGVNTIDGLTSDLPSGLIHLQVEGNNTIHGDISLLPTGLITLSLLGSNYVNGDIAGITSFTGLVYLLVAGSNGISGDIADLPPNLINVQIDGLNTLLGNISDFPSSLTYIDIRGGNTIGGNTSGFVLTGVTVFMIISAGTTISGDIANLSGVSSQLAITGTNAISGNIMDVAATLTYLDIEGNNIIAGLLLDLPSGLRTCIISGSNTLSGDINIDLPASLTYIVLQSTSATYTYTHVSPRTWASNMRKITLVRSTPFTTTEVDNMLIDLATTSWSAGGIINLSGTRSSASDAARVILIGLSVSVTP